MLPERRVSSRPGIILLEDFLKPLGVSQVAFAKHVRVPLQRVNEVVRGRRGVTPDTAWRFAQALGTTPEFWLNLQATHDLSRRRPRRVVRRLVATQPRVA
jgi:addiction module HigA family antidote